MSPISLVLMAAAAIAAGDPITGVWVFDAKASQGGQGQQTLTITVRDGEETYLSEWSQPGGPRSIASYVARYDGPRAPLNSFAIDAQGRIEARPGEVELRTVDARHRETRFIRGGKVVRLLKKEMSEDRQTLTTDMLDADAAGVLQPKARLIFRRR